MANDRRHLRRDVWAVVPVKETAFAKQRLSHVLSPSLRQALALAMFEDVIEALADVPELDGVAVVTEDPLVTEIALRWRAHVWTEGARDGHTGAVTAASRRLAARGSAMLAIPGDVPLVLPVDISGVLRAHSQGRAFTIVPAWDDRGSNTIVASPADAVPLRFGADSFFPHLAAARKAGLIPTTIRNPAIALDIDEPLDLARFVAHRSSTRSWALLDDRSSAWSDTPAAVLEAL
jgi:2-phospho-L-lactate/phosphoenolpyruvate guanylyltransferase